MSDEYYDYEYDQEPVDQGIFEETGLEFYVSNPNTDTEEMYLV